MYTLLYTVKMHVYHVQNSRFIVVIQTNALICMRTLHKIQFSKRPTTLELVHFKASAFTFQEMNLAFQVYTYKVCYSMPCMYVCYMLAY